MRTWGIMLVAVTSHQFYVTENFFAASLIRSARATIGCSSARARVSHVVFELSHTNTPALL